MKIQHLFFIIAVLWLSFSACSSSPRENPDLSKDRHGRLPVDNTKQTKVDQPRTSDDSPKLRVSASTEKLFQRIYADYGAVFKAQGVIIPPTIMFAARDECEKWQATVGTAVENIDGFNIELQTNALRAFIKAREDAAKSGYEISPRGTDAAKRDYDDTVRLWNSRVNPALEFWKKQGRLQQSEVERIKKLGVIEQVNEILNLESLGMNFSTDFSKSILYSVAAPGTSQHLSMLALDVEEHENPSVRKILAENGWHQTIISDLPHFTYLGVSENQISALQLRKISRGGRTFWIP